ncbi:bifunctional helix-turn-helix transcriptional regulator/GNAT family N-acetyltransferase [Aquibium oceanicum]|uniref:MarR family transcriptional regulator n=1 Tax=Aquibium oceanicum TaxID=1670800 RepID=A0A1L3SKU2_9HYPH|nr:helix-turn-helix domain-containing GNAT family N-acetyltransferase [Aquibium oceanicum]APH70027.1 MarR family transcriptional regulator [Aquibium oceanicum]
MANDDPRHEEAIAQVRDFNRFYTRFLGALNEGLLKSPYSLSESRILYELGTRDRVTASQLSAELGMDPAYLSRLLKKLREAGLVLAAASAEDGRATELSLAPAGRKAFESLDSASHDEISEILAPLGPDGAGTLVGAMQRIRAALDPSATDNPPYVIRPHRIGDIGIIISRQGALYAQEYGWDGTFEGFVAEIAGAFAKSHDPKRERCWVAERHAEVVGSVFLVDAGGGTAKLRMLWVEPSTRGLGIGGRLVEECIRFARQTGYQRMTLWTNDILVSARRIYEKAGFRLVAEERHHSFGKDLVGQNWEMEL